MTKLDLVLERIRQLPQDRQDAIAAELACRLSDPERKYVSHQEVGAYFEKNYGR